MYKIPGAETHVAIDKVTAVGAIAERAFYWYRSERFHYSVVVNGAVIDVEGGNYKELSEGRAALLSQTGSLPEAVADRRSGGGCCGDDLSFSGDDLSGGCCFYD